MTIYLVQLFLILLLSARFHPASSRKGKIRFVCFCFFILTVVSGMRGDSVGADTISYVRLFENIDSIDILNSRFEPGFILFLKILHVFSDNPGFLLFTVSSTCVGTYSYFVNRFSKSPTISILLYVLLGAYFSQMNTMRQALALSITMWGFVLMLNGNVEKRNSIKNKLISALLILLASTIHTVAIVAFIPWLLLIRGSRFEDESRLTMSFAVLRTLMLAVAVFFGYSAIMRLSSTIFPGYSHYFYGKWSDSNYFASLLKTLISIVFLIVGTLIFRNKKLTYIQRFSAIMLCLSIIFQVLSMRMEIWGRIVSIFGIYTYVIWIPELLNEIRLNSNRRIIETGIVLFSFAYMVIVLVFRPEWTRVVPFVFR